jgi:hypothetical protein
MARTPAQDALEEVIRAGLAPALRADGYRKDGHTFRRERERCVQVVNVQSSRWDTSSEVQFTVNLGVFFPEVHALMEPGWGPGPGGPREAHCTLRSRIGELMPERKDHWWTLRPPSRFALFGGTSERVAGELRAAFDQYASPWLQRLSDLRAARDEAERTSAHVVAAACSVVLGDEESARRNAARLAREAPQATAAVEWARRHGLLS